MGRPAAAHAAWPQRRGGGLSLVTGRPRDLARVRKASSALPRRVQYSFLRMSIYSFLLQHGRCCRRRHQRHGRIQERSGPEMYTVSCATSSLLPLLRAPSSHGVGFGRCSPSTTSTTPRARHPSPILEGLLSRNRLARGAFASCCRNFVFVSLAWLRWCAYGAPARLADSTSWISCFATTRWSVVTLDPGKNR